MFEKIVAEIDTEIARLNKVKTLLITSVAPAKRGPGRPAKVASTTTPKKAKRRKIGAEAREKIRQTQLKRWATQKKGAKKSAK